VVHVVPELLDCLRRSRGSACLLTSHTITSASNLMIMWCRQQRAFELASALALEQSLQGALRLANHHHATVLAERVAAFIESRLEMEQMARQQARLSVRRNTA